MSSNKIKVLAIEQEIANLELELCRDYNTFLTAKSSEDKTRDIETFESSVLNPVIEDLNKSITDPAKKFSRAGKMYTPDILAYFKAKPKDQPKSTTAQIISTISNVVSRVSPGSSSNSDDPACGWPVTYNRNTIYVVIGHQSDDSLGLYVVSAEQIHSVKYTPKLLKVLWNKPQGIRSFFIQPIEKLKNQIEQCTALTGSSASPAKKR